MAERNRTAVDVEAFQVEPEAANVVQGDGGEGVAHLPQVDVGHAQVGARQCLAGRVHRAGLRERYAGVGMGQDACTHRQCKPPCRRLGAEQYGCRAVRHARRIAGGVNVRNLPQFGLALQAPGVQAVGARFVDGAQHGEFLGRVGLADVFVVVEQHFALGIVYRHHGVGQPALSGCQGA